MAYLNWRFIIRLLFIFTLCFPLVHCTSSDDDTSVLDQELETMNVDLDEDDLDDLDDSGDLADDELADLDDDSEELLDDELDDLDEDFAESSDDEVVAENKEEDFEDFDDSEFADDELDSQQEVADFDEEGFDDFESFGKDNKVAQNEEGLAKELGQEGDYPISMDEPAFPEEVMASEASGQPPAPIVDPGQGQAPGVAGDSVITSETQAITAVPPEESPLPSQDLGQPDPLVPEEAQDDEVAWVPVVKVKSDPFFRNERLMNAVYIARPDDDLSGISQKIYGADKTSELLSDNRHLQKGVDPGDKVYYNSPNRPGDNSQLKVYYDDVGLPAQTYTTEENDNMRRLGSKLLGFADGWKEIWAINPTVDSKTVLPAGLKLKYWTGNEERPSLQMATTAPEEPEVSTEVAQADPNSMGQVTEIGAEDPFASGELPPEPPLPEPQLDMAQENLDPEPVPDIEAFPDEGVEFTPSPVAAAQMQTTDDSLLTVGVVALLLIAGVALMAIQIKKRKEATGMTPQSLEYTQA